MGHINDAGEVLRRHTAAQLREELDFFHRHKSEWLPMHRGEFVLIGKAAFGGFHPSYAAAVQAGTRMFGLITPFLVKQISD